MLDSDWNAQISLSEQAIRERIETIVGRTGIPAENPGFDIRPITGVCVNSASTEKVAEGIVLQHSRSLPFARVEASSRPFHMKIGFALKSTVRATGTLVHIPEFLCLNIIETQKLQLAFQQRGQTGDFSQQTITGKTSLNLDQTYRLDLSFDGSVLQISLSNEWGHLETEITTELQSHDAGLYDPLGLLLGCRQNTTARPNMDGSLDQGTAYDQPLPAVFWHLNIQDDFVVYAEETALGLTLNSLVEETVCSLDFSSLEDGYLTDQSTFQNNGLLLMEDRAVQIELVNVVISKGDILNTGDLFKNETARLLTHQPYRTGPNFPTQSAPRTEPVFYRFYLDCWSRYITDLEAPQNHDPALGQIDTTVDLQSFWHVNFLQAESPESLEAKWYNRTQTDTDGKLRLRRRLTYQAITNGLLRVEIHHTGWCFKWPLSEALLDHAFAVQLHEGQHQQIALTDSADLALFKQLNRPVLVFTAPRLTGNKTRETAVGSYVQTNIVGVQKLENGLLVNLQSAAPVPGKEETLYILPVASYKYSQNNGCLAYPVNEMSWLEDQHQISASLSSSGYNGLEIQNGDWVEFENLSSQENETPGPLFEVKEFISDQLQLLLNPQSGYSGAANTAFDIGQYPTLTKWEGLFDQTSAPITPSTWELLFDGIELEFEAGKYYKSGQYWSSAMREALKHGIDWPGVDQNKSEFLPPEGPKHQFTALADITLERRSCFKKDRRKHFRALVDEPFADLDEETALLLIKVARLAELLGLNDWQIDKTTFPLIMEAFVRFLLNDVYQGQLAILGTEAEAPDGLYDTGVRVKTNGSPKLNWQETSTLPPDLNGEAITAFLSGRPVVIFLADNSIRQWSASENEWQLLTHIPRNRDSYTVAWDDSRLYIIGGQEKGLFDFWRARQIWALNAAGHWRIVGCLPRRRIFSSAAIADNHLYLTGGFDHKGESAERGISTSLTRWKWHWLDTISQPRSFGAASILIDTRWFIFGGKNVAPISGKETILDQVEVYNTVSRQWQVRTSMPLPLYGHRLLRTDAGIYVIGGTTTNEVYSNACFLYDPEGDRWLEVGELSLGRNLFALAPLRLNGMLQACVIGGQLRHDLTATDIEMSPLDENLFIYR
ncbi:MAG: hypothetical protein ACJAYR_001549 [Sneathiella sp.]|jgi:hypothetical protein